MSVDALVQGHTRMAQLEDLVRVLDVIAYLIVDDAGRVDEPVRSSQSVTDRGILDGMPYRVKDKLLFWSMACESRAM